MAGQPENAESTGARRLVLVCGAGRSGTSTLAGLLKLLAVRVPQPEVEADESNPRGFAEPRWVVDLHDRLLRRRIVEVADARPRAFEFTAEVAEPVRDRTAAWLAEQFAQAPELPELVVKDPRLSWFLPLWREAAERCGAAPVFATMLRPPAEVVGSRQAYYGAAAGDPHLIATWLNMQLFTEALTRDAGPRAFVRYADLLDDAEGTVRVVGDRLGLRAVREADDERWAAARGFVDPGLRRMTQTLDDLRLPTELRRLTEETWRALDELATLGPDGETSERHEHLDQLRDAYVALYDDAQSLARSTAIAAEERGRRAARRAASTEAPEADDAPPGRRRPWRRRAGG